MRLLDECVVCGKPATNLHHVIYGRLYGKRDDVQANRIPLCGWGNASGCHGKLHAYDEATRQAIGVALRQRPDTVAYVKLRLGDEAGLAYLERRYAYEP